MKETVLESLQEALRHLENGVQSWERITKMEEQVDPWDRDSVRYDMRFANASANVHVMFAYANYCRS